MPNRDFLKHIGFTTAAAIAASKINIMEQSNEPGIDQGQSGETPEDRLKRLFAEADQTCKNIRQLLDGMKSRKICSNCGIDYPANETHACY